ncbi:phospholipase D family protein [Gordonia sp. (in: high G+C Gram-positive bacteria)]|uniref:phospholipase D family protein n=1 Tax=Gordonia sp. (in: high G+C Gram-positive bacteria) TaxID=84139 RepID=UPI003C708F8E
MLPPDSRTTLLKQLAPEPGSAIEYLLGTTFTLDLESALLPCLALAGSASPDAADAVEKVAAITASVQNVDIFHQVGKVSVPKDQSPLFSLLENSIHGIHRPHGLFHPKVWIGQYLTDDGEQTIRLLILSRNLTKDRSWDVALSVDGVVGSRRNPMNVPLVNLLAYLGDSNSLPERTSQRIASLRDLILKADWDLPPGAIDLGFHVYGLPGRKAPQPDFSGYKHLVVSPFLTDDGFDRLTNDARGPVYVVSRQESLDGLSTENADWIDEAFVLSPDAGISSEDEDASSNSILSGLHAKFYAVERSKRSHLFVGSANATGAAFTSNVEILAELTGQTKTFGVDAFLGKEGLASIIAGTDINSGKTDHDEVQARLDNYVRVVAGIPLTATLMASDETAMLAVTSDGPVPTFDENVKLSLALLTDQAARHEVACGAPVRVEFRDLKLSNVTAFLVLSVEIADGTTAKTVLKAELLGDDPRRYDSIVTAQLDSPEAFRRLLALILAFGVSPSSDDGAGGEPLGGQGTSWKQFDQGLFELVMRSSVSNTDGLRHLSGVVSSIIAKGDPNSVLPEGFSELWAAVSAATQLEGVEA